MKLLKTIFISFFLFLTLSGGYAQSLELKNSLDSASYALGMSVGYNIKQQGASEINAEAFSTAINDVLKNAQLQIPFQEINAIIQNYFKTIQEEKFGPVMEKNKQFLAKNKENEGVVELPNGLQYKILQKGDGEKPKPTDKVKVHYHGTLTDGTVFDSSVDRGQPAVFTVNGVIKGWQEALQLMPVGSKWRLFIPPELAYGKKGAGQKIGPYSLLIFDVELLSIEK